jgi:riboflavin kinase/FMN adenylyltransferase
MNIYRTFDEIPFDANTVVTIGTFDGVHRGHQFVLKRLYEIAESIGGRAVVLTFDPHPQIVLLKPGREPVQLLTTIDERLEVFKKYDAPNVLIIPFTYEFSRTSPEDFITEYLVKKIGLKKILVGYDHMFGRNREGSDELLKELGEKYGFDVEKMPPLSHAEDIIISSTKIRHALKDGNLAQANEMLGYPYFVRGKVVHGHKRGRTLGIPTANFAIPDAHKLMPKNGVYWVSSEIDRVLKHGMANLGTRPTFTDETEATLEVNYFDFDGDLYGRELSVNFLHYIREERKYDSAEAMMKEIANDRRICEELLKVRRNRF